jgi:hypothetical protein
MVMINGENQSGEVCSSSHHMLVGTQVDARGDGCRIVSNQVNFLKGQDPIP